MEVLYRSTRGNGSTVTASNAILKGLSEDGGLFVPDQIPVLDVPMDVWPKYSRFFQDFNNGRGTPTINIRKGLILVHSLAIAGKVNGGHFEFFLLTTWLRSDRGRSPPSQARKYGVPQRRLLRQQASVPAFSSHR